MATEPTGSMPEGMQSNGSPTEVPSIPTGDHGEGGGAQERARVVAGTAADEAKELARQAGGQARQVAQEAKHELRTLTEQGRQELKSQAQAQERLSAEAESGSPRRGRDPIGSGTRLARSTCTGTGEPGSNQAVLSG